MDIDWIEFETLPSTSLWAKENLKDLSASKVSVISTKIQTAGYGQHGRSWNAGSGENICLTLVIPLAAPPKNLGGLSLCFAYACCETLSKDKVPLKIKWPNDLVLESGKIGGVLGEIATENNRTYLVLGFGFNVGMQKQELQAIDQKANSLYQYQKQDWDKTLISKHIIENFVTKLPKYLKSELTTWKDAIEKKLLFQHEEITFLSAGQTYKGYLQGITQEGYLVLNTMGENKVFVSGQIAKSSK